MAKLLLSGNADGSFKWESDEWTRDANELEDGGGPAIGDMDGDGLAEIAIGDHIFDHNGRLIMRPTTKRRPARASPRATMNSSSACPLPGATRSCPGSTSST